MAFTTTYSITPLLTRILPGALNQNSDSVGLTGDRWATVADTPGGSAITVYDAAGNAAPWGTLPAQDTTIAQLTNGSVVEVGTHIGGGVDFRIQDEWGSLVSSGPLTANTTDSNADVAALAGGGFVVVNQVDFSAGAGTSGDHDILFQIRDSAGNYVGQFSVDYSVANDQNASVAGLADGGFAVAWERIDASGNSTAWYAVYAPNGMVRKAPSQFDGNGTVNHQMSITALSSGGFVVSYEDNEFGGAQSDLRVVSFSASGNKYYQYASVLATTDSEAAITVLSNGFIMSTFTNLSDVDHQVYDIRGALLSAAGDTLTDPFHPLTIDSSGDADGHSSVSATGLAQFVVSYTRQANQDVVQKTFQLVRTATGDGSDDSFTGDDAVDVVNGMGGNDTLNGAANNDRLGGGDGLDALHGGDGNDSLNGGTGNDLLFGDAGNDWLDGGAEGDGLAGGGGNDTYIVDNAADAVNETSALAAEIDTVLSSVSYALGANVENLILTGGNAIGGTGNGLANTITGNAAANIIRGGGGNDTMDGGAGFDTADYTDRSVKVDVTLNGGIDVSVKINDVVEDTIRNIEKVAGGSFGDALRGDGLANALTGNGGSDTMRGGGGNDTLAGGRGKDKLTGGADADVFRFNTALGRSNIDKVTDFVHRDDTIQLENAIMVALGTSFTASEFIAKSSGHVATRASQHIVYDKSNGTLWYDSDGKGAHAAVQLAQLGTSASHPTHLDYTDFAIV